MNRRRSLRARLAVLYACLLLGSGFLLLAAADLPLTATGRAARARPGGKGAAAAAPRFFTNLPEVLRSEEHTSELQSLV